jgi:hypothetical protein
MPSLTVLALLIAVLMICSGIQPAKAKEATKQSISADSISAADDAVDCLNGATEGVLSGLYSCGSAAVKHFGAPAAVEMAKRPEVLKAAADAGIPIGKVVLEPAKVVEMVSKTRYWFWKVQVPVEKIVMVKKVVPPGDAGELAARGIDGVAAYAGVGSGVGDFVMKNFNPVVNGAMCAYNMKESGAGPGGLISSPCMSSALSISGVGTAFSGPASLACNGLSLGAKFVGWYFSGNSTSP